MGSLALPLADSWLKREHLKFQYELDLKKAEASALREKVETLIKECK